MKIVNVNGRLETRGTWEEAEAQATAQVAGIAQTRTELRAMLSGNMQFHEDPHAAAPMVHIGVDMGAPSGDYAAVWVVRQGQTHTVTGGAAALHNLPKAPKPPAVWRTAEQIPQSERNGLWFCKCGAVGWARHPKFDGSVLYLRAPEGVEFGTDYDPSMYQQPDADGWFTHDPREDSVCPVPAGVKYEVRFGHGAVCGGELRKWDWAERSEDRNTIVAWRVVA